MGGRCDGLGQNLEYLYVLACYFFLLIDSFVVEQQILFKIRFLSL